MSKYRDTQFLFLSISILFILMINSDLCSQLPSEFDSIYVENVVGNRGDTVIIAVGMVNSISIGGFTLRFIYDDLSIRLTSVSLTERDSGFYEEPFLDTTQSGIGRIVCISSNPIRHPIPIGRGSVLAVKFYIDSNAVSGSSLIHFEDRGPNTYDNALSDSSGSLLIIPCLVDGFIIVTPLMISDGFESMSAMYNIRNSPNPFNNNTLISFNTMYPSQVSIVVYDIVGRKISTLDQGFMNRGSYSVNWDGRSDIGKEVSSGIYCYSLFIENKRVSSNRMVFLK